MITKINILSYTTTKRENKKKLNDTQLRPEKKRWNGIFEHKKKTLNTKLHVRQLCCGKRIFPGPRLRDVERKERE
jgi:hypothetical protein